MSFYPFTPASGGGQGPDQFRPETYGARGDGLVYNDGTISSTSKNFSSTLATFTAADVGKHIMINGAAGSTSQPLISTIASVASAHQVVLADAATATVASGGQFIYGTDDTAAINRALAAAKTYAMADNWNAEILFSARNYIIAGAPTQASSPYINAQIPIPFPDPGGATRKLVITFTGVCDLGQAQYYESTIPNLAGTCLVSMATCANTPDPSFGLQSVIGGPTSTGGLTGEFANTKAVITGIMVMCPVMTNLLAIDLRYIGGFDLDTSSCQVFSSVLGNAPAIASLPGIAFFRTDTIGVGLYASYYHNNDDCNVGTFTVEGFNTGVAISEHFTAQRICAVYCDTGLFVQSGTSAVIHGASILYYSCEATNVALLSANNGGQMPINIGLMDTEVINTTDISDTGNDLYGIVHWADFARTTLNVTGAASLKIVNDRLTSGIWGAAPAVPATTVAATNTAYRDATVYVTSGGGTVTVIKVDGTATGLTLAVTGTVTARVPSGGTIALTYAAAAPTWVWVLD